MKMSEVIEKTCYSDEETSLFRAVMRQMSASWSEVWDFPSGYRDPSTGVGGFIYYSDTEPFAKRNITNILLVLNEFEQEIGEPLKKDNDNLMNWYAWFALEHVIDKVMQAKEE